MHNILSAYACLCIVRQGLCAGRYILIFLALFVSISNSEVLESEKIENKLAHVRIGGKWGYIDPAGKMVINPQFDAASPFSEGLAHVRIGGKWGYIDPAGKMVINPQFDAASPFSEGLAYIKIGGNWRGGRWGYIDPAGKMVILIRQARWSSIRNLTLPRLFQKG